MTPTTELSRHPARAGRRVLGSPRRLVLRVRQMPGTEPVTLAVLLLATAGATGAGLVFSTAWFPPALLALPLLFGGLLLTVAPLRWLAAAVAAALVVDVTQRGWEVVRPGGLAVVLVTGLVAHEYARSRQETGLRGLSSDAVLMELRARLEQQGQTPELPRGWEAEVVVEPAGGGPFAGDFVVSALVDARCFEIALVDVSGKGIEAGTRSLLLSGAMGGLLGHKDPQDFLAAANAYLIRQQWEEGFATAVHLVVDLPSGDFEIGSAGHLPVAHFDAGSGRWGLLDAEGPALGLLPNVRYAKTRGRLRAGDALLLYTDGLVEVPGRDLDRGIDKLLGAAEGLVTRGFRNGGRLLVKQVSERSIDDRGLVLLWRDPA